RSWGRRRCAGNRISARFPPCRPHSSARSRRSPIWPNLSWPHRCLGHLMKIGTTHFFRLRGLSMTELTDITGPATPAEPVAFPQPQPSPPPPPPAYEPLRDGRALPRAPLFDGREVWMVPGHSPPRALLAAPRLSPDRTRPGFPVPIARF